MTMRVFGFNQTGGKLYINTYKKNNKQIFCYFDTHKLIKKNKRRIKREYNRLT